MFDTSALRPREVLNAVAEAVTNVCPPNVNRVEVAALRLVLIVPVLAMLNSVVVEFAVDEPIANNTFAVSPLFACKANLANGDVVPTATEPPIYELPVVVALENTAPPLKVTNVVVAPPGNG